MTEQLEIEDFDTAKAVFEKLKDVPAERRKRILNWVAEGLGILLHAAPLAAAASVATPPAASAPLSHPGITPEGAATDIKTFVVQKAPKSDVQFATTVAYYYRFEAPAAQRRDAINSETLQEAARLAGRKRLATPIKTLNNAKTQGYLDGASRGEFAINSVGENLIAMTLPGVLQGGAVGRSSKAKNARKKGGRKG